jgi:O-antigen/teichoic acid export membrane protein
MDLARRILDGGRQLAVRQAAGIALGFVNLLILTRLLGPADYGMFAGSLGIFAFVVAVTQLGLNVYLIRRAEDPPENEYDQAFSLYLAIGGAVAVLGLAAAAAAERWTGIAGFGAVLAAMLAAAPISLATLVPQARLERRLDYKRVTRIDVLVQAITIAVAAPLAALGGGAWAPVAGWLVGQVLGAALYFTAARYRPRLLYRAEVARPMLRYGIGFSGAGLLWQLRLLVNPLVVGRFAGVEAMGIVALATRLVEILGFMQTAGWRLAIPVFGQLQGDPATTLRRMKQAMVAQAILVGLPLVAFCMLGPIVVPLLFGGAWLDVPAIFPFLAFAFLAGTVFGPPAAVLQVRGYHGEVALSSAAYVAILAGATFALVPQHGTLGYALSVLLTVPASAILALGVRRRLGVWAVGPALVFALGIGVLLFWREAGWFVVVGAAAALSVREAREESIDLVRILRNRLSWSS